MFDPHTVMFTMDGPQDIVHPDTDREACGFEAYLTSDWSEAMQYYLGPWQFTWVEPAEDPGYWNGSRL